MKVLAKHPEEGAPNLLFLLFHGMGADAAQMAPLAQALHQTFPQAAVLCVEAPDAFDGIPGGGAGWQWFSEQGITDQDRHERVAQAMPRFLATVRALQKHYGIEWERTALAGFSQGAMMALEAVQADLQLASRVLSFGGGYALLPSHAPTHTVVHLFHGLNDDVLPHQPLVQCAKELLDLGGDVTADILPDLGHELHARLIDKAVFQLQNFIPKRLWQEAVLAAEAGEASKH